MLIKKLFSELIECFMQTALIGYKLCPMDKIMSGRDHIYKDGHKNESHRRISNQEDRASGVNLCCLHICFVNSMSLRRIFKW